MKDLLKFMVYLFTFIILTTFNCEYFINRQSSTPYLILALIIEFILFYFLIIKPTKKYIL